MRFLSVFLIFLSSGCSFVAPINQQTKCESKINNVDPMDTVIRVNKEVTVESANDSRYTVLKEGLYYPAMHWEKCKYVSYAAEEDLEIKATNKFKNFIEKGNDPGGIQINTNEPEKVHIIWYYRSGTGYLSFTPLNAEQIDFEILYKKETVNKY